MKSVERALPSSPIQPVELQAAPDSSPKGPALLGSNLSLVSGVKVGVEVVIGSAELTIGELFSLQSGAVLKLDQLKDAPLSIRLEGKTVALGRLVVVDDCFGVCITEIQSAPAVATKV